MSANKIKSVPVPTLKRLTRYIHLLTRLRNEGVRQVSSTVIASELQLDPTQVRKDIQFTGIVGKPKTGFPVDNLIEAIREFLNWNNTSDAFLVGVGHLGAAMLGYREFRQYGLNFVAAFDVAPSKVGTQIAGVHVLPLSKLTNLAQRMHVHIGVITVPPDAAQAVADMMVAGGIRAIWNFAPVQIKVPDQVIVENAQLTQSLAVLTHKLSESLEIKS
ncbi:MAG: redox-sensing transcriptional repressor Rex [Calditrichia bacterium]